MMKLHLYLYFLASKLGNRVSNKLNYSYKMALKIPYLVIVGTIEVLYYPQCIPSHIGQVISN